MAQTHKHVFLWRKILLEKRPMGEENRHPKCETTKIEKTQKYTRTFIDQNI